MKTKKKNNVTDVNFSSSLVRRSTEYRVYEVDYINHQDISRPPVYSSSSLSDAKRFCHDYAVNHPEYFDGSHGLYISAMTKSISCIHVKVDFHD